MHSKPKLAEKASYNSLLKNKVNSNVYPRYPALAAWNAFRRQIFPIAQRVPYLHIIFAVGRRIHKLKLCVLLSYTKLLAEIRGGTRNFPTGGLTLPIRGLKYDFQGTINAKNLRKNRVSPSDGGLACSNGEAIAP